MADRYVLLGLAGARAPWFRAVAQWATSASIGAEFVKCISAEEVQARLASGRPHSALLVDAGLAAFDRDLAGAAMAAYTPVIAVRDGRGQQWSASDLGVAAVLDPDFDREDLVDALRDHARTVDRADRLPPLVAEDITEPWRGQLVAVCGPGGTGVSTVAVALAQALAADPRYGRRVVLADLALRADQALLHDAGELGPGVAELVEAHRLGRPGPDDVRGHTFDVPARGYRLLLGLRRPAGWAAMRPRAIDAALDGLLRSFQLVVADVTGDLEGEDEGGSADVAERNHLARAAVTSADIVVVVGSPGLKGVHSLGRTVGEVLALGVPAARVLTALNRAPRHPRARSELAGALRVAVGPAAVIGPVFVPERRVEEALRDGVALPAAVVTPLGGAVRALVDRLADLAPPGGEPVAVTPGSLGSWSDGGLDVP